MLAAAVKEGLDEKRAALEELSTNTSESLTNTFDLLKGELPKGMLVVCSSYMARRIDLYTKRELKKRGLTEKVKVFIFDADVAEDMEGNLTPEALSDRQRRSILYEAKRLSRYRQKGDL